MNKISIIGLGSFGKALFYALQQNTNNNITICSQTASNTVKEKHKITKDLQIAINQSDYIFICIPSFQLTNLVAQISKIGIEPSKKLIICSKGLINQQNQVLLSSQIFANAFPKNEILILSGPSFADEITQDIPTVVNVASNGANTSIICNLFNFSNITAIPFTNIMNLQIFGSYKNVLAMIINFYKSISTQLNATNQNSTENKIATIWTKLLQDGILVANFLCQKEKYTQIDINQFISVGISGDIFLTTGSLKSRNSKFGTEYANIIFKKLKESFSSEIITKSICDDDLGKLINKIDLSSIKPPQYTCEGLFALDCFNNICKQNNLETHYLSKAFTIFKHFITKQN